MSPDLLFFQCRYHYGALVQESPVTVDISHAPANPAAWQHTGWVCSGCRDYLKGQWRHCRCAR